MISVKEATDRTGNTGNGPEAFIRNDQFNFIKDQARVLVTGQATGNDKEVLDVLRHLAQEKVFKLFPDLTAEQQAVLTPLAAVKETADAEIYLEQLIPYLIPFKTVSEQSLKKMFPKVKKLKGPKLDAIDYKKLSYLSWIESSNLMYMVIEKDGRLDGIQGSFTRSGKKGICSICNRHSEVGLFTAKTKGSGQDTFIKRGNYVCQSNENCNSNIETLDRLYDFVERLQK